MTNSVFPVFTTAANCVIISRMNLENLFSPDSYHFDDSGMSPALFWRGGPFLLTARICDDLVTATRRLGNKNLRICLHASPDAPLQNMVVLTWRGRDIPPHCHPGKTESLHIIYGRMRVHFYNDSGDRVNSYEIGPGKDLFVSAPAGACHENEVLSEYALFHEIKLVQSDDPAANVFPSWAQG